MEDKVQLLLDEVIEEDIQRLTTLKVGSDERSNAVEELTKLHKLRIEEVKVEADYVSKNKQREDERVARIQENSLRREQLRSQNIDRWVNFGLQAGVTIGGWIMFTLWQKSEQKFEMTGTPTTPIFRGLLSRMIPNLKR